MSHNLSNPTDWQIPHRPITQETLAKFLHGYEPKTTDTRTLNGIHPSGEGSHREIETTLPAGQHTGQSQATEAIPDQASLAGDDEVEGYARGSRPDFSPEGTLQTSSPTPNRGELCSQVASGKAESREGGVWVCLDPTQLQLFRRTTTRVI